MKKALVRSAHPFFKNNYLFYNRDVIKKHPLVRPWLVLYDELQRYGIELVTKDCQKSREAYAFELQIDTSEAIDIPNIGIHLESPAVIPTLAEREFWDQSDHVFTWLKVFNEEKFIQINHPTTVEEVRSSGPKLYEYCLISARKSNENGRLIGYDIRDSYLRHARELKLPLRLYGRGWDKFVGDTRLKRMANRLIPAWALRVNPFPELHFGEIDKKEPIIGHSKFTFAIENTDGYENYVSEKIIDALRCYSLPLYWGHEAVRKYIPDDIFIDLKNFDSPVELFHFCNTLSAADYCGYIHRIKRFLQGGGLHPFSPEAFAKKLVSNILCRI